MYELIVTSEDSGKRVDNVTMRNMVRLYPELDASRTLIQRMMGAGKILLNGRIYYVGIRR